ncbi:hypothetical protein ODJ79_43030 [Actinoplanes sp. KI2]|uniref:hypothetical protein n=1 Tax=Actinoplanes sp. KI2 TaxID=2983315 RepID=UPI0021D5DAC9|nr:hypothetical protein [Actinoplanes sp. KI2]MCU7730531.1 hypothetical protein [Actinoplanes sp. KI2]
MSGLLATAADLVRSFAEMLTGLHGGRLGEWIAAAQQAGLPGIASFTNGLTSDLDAVTAGLTLPRSSGPVEATSTGSRCCRCTAEPASTCSASECCLPVEQARTSADQ